MTVLDQVGVDLADRVEAANEAARRAQQIEAIAILMDVSNNGAIIVDDDLCTFLEVPFGSSQAIVRNEFRPAPE